MSDLNQMIQKSANALVVAPQSRAQIKIKSLSVVGLVIVFILVFVIGGWLSMAQLSGAVIASGRLVVETSVKEIQHASGGIVSQIYVEDGSIVEAGEILVRLDDTVPYASRAIYRAQLDESLARQDRLSAEVLGVREVTFVDELVERASDPAVLQIMNREEQLFVTRVIALDTQNSQLRERISQIDEEIAGLEAQFVAKSREIELIDSELLGVRELYEKDLVPLTRVNQLEREQARLAGQFGQLTAEIARARGRIIETELQIVQIDNQYRDTALSSIAETQVQLAELQERLTAADDQLERVNITSPQDGIVHLLQIHTVGGVVGAGQTIMQIIPTADALVVDAQISPPDIDQIFIGALVRVQIQAGNQRTVPELDGIIVRVSADLTEDRRTGLGYYSVRVKLPDDAQEQLGELTLVPGMASTAFIQTGSRTALQYLLKPLMEQVSRTFRER